MRFALLTLILTTGIYFTAAGQNILSFPLGEFWQFGDARTLGMAGAGSVSNSSGAALLMNPAAMAAQQEGLHFMLAPRGRSLDDRRSFPVFNRIDDITQQGIYAVNNNWFFQLQGAVQYRFEWKSFPYLKTVAAGVFQEIEQDFRYDEEVRENIFGDQLLAYNSIDYDGRLTRYAFGAALQPAGPLQAGFQIGALSGDLTSDSAVTFLSGSARNLNSHTTRSLDNTPIVASAGVIYQVNPYFSLGGHARLPYTVKYRAHQVLLDNFTGAQAEQTVAEEIQYPLQLTAALEYRGRQELQARLNVDFTYERWSDSEHTINGLPVRRKLDDAIMIKVGVEHVFFDQVPFQVGLQYRTTYTDNNRSRIMVGAGTGFRGDQWEVDLAAGISKRSYSFPDLFDDARYGGDRSNSSIDTVEERYFFSVATLKLHLR